MLPQTCRFNVNNRVLVRLTKEGRAELARKHQQLENLVRAAGGRLPAFSIREDHMGYSEWSMWDLMSQLGHMMGLGCVLPFETEIILLKEFRGEDQSS